jgi:hypothetical protein
MLVVRTSRVNVVTAFDVELAHRVDAAIEEAVREWTPADPGRTAESGRRHPPPGLAGGRLEDAGPAHDG